MSTAVTASVTAAAAAVQVTVRDQKMKDGLLAAKVLGGFQSIVEVLLSKAANPQVLRVPVQDRADLSPNNYMCNCTLCVRIHKLKVFCV